MRKTGLDTDISRTLEIDLSSSQGKRLRRWIIMAILGLAVVAAAVIWWMTTRTNNNG